MLPLAVNIWFFCASFFLHPIHIAVSEIYYNPEHKSLEITHKLFIDDFDDALMQRFGLKLHLDTQKEHPDTDYYVQKYIAETFRFSANGKETKLDFVGYEADGEAFWIYQEVKRLRKIKEISLRVGFLFNIFDDQKNIVHFRYLSHKKSYLFGKGDRAKSGKF